MTHNQIEYWKLKETARTNRAQEKERERSARASEDINYAGVAENVRHNLEGERLQAMSLEEAARHNAATEGEAIRSNLQNEAIRTESNKINLSLGLGQIETSKYGAAMSAGASRYATDRNVAELSRHNLATEEYSYFKTDVDKSLGEAGVEARNREIDLKQQQQNLAVRAQDETERRNQNLEFMQKMWENNQVKLKQQEIEQKYVQMLVDARPGATLLTNLVPVLPF